jgi:hypothetical protein
MAQSREVGFHPSSPHSSSGGADSFKGTPDTRLTALSPDEGSTKSTRFLRNVGLAGAEAQPVRFPVNSYRGAASHIDKDPFVSVPSTKTPQKLSPTASAFRPYAASSVDATPTAFDDFQRYFEPIHQPISSSLSAELGLSRCLAVAAASKILDPADVEAYLAVR